MAARSDAGSVKKVFEHCKITWRIENYFLATFGKSWNIRSPVIHVKEPRTKWKMFLTPDSKNDQLMFFRLHRFKSCPGPNSVRVDWRMTLVAKKGGVEHEYRVSKGERSFGKGEFEIVILKRESILKRIVFPFEDKDTFCIRFQMIVSHESVDETSELFARDYNLENLQNFIDKHADGKISDIRIRNGRSRTINAHKEILSSRSRRCENEIKEGVKCIKFDIDRIRFTKIIAYLYSGELEHVISNPSLFLNDIIKTAKIKELKLHYEPYWIKLNTALDVQYNEFRWTIENVSGRTHGTILTSPILSDATSETFWELKLQVKVVKKCMHMSISAKSIEPEMKAETNTSNSNNPIFPMLAFAELVPMADKIHCFQRSRVTTFMQRNAILQNENFFEIKLSNIQSMLPENKLHIVFRIQLLLSGIFSNSSGSSNRMTYVYK